jgi:ankyrin repeat protein
VGLLRERGALPYQTQSSNANTLALAASKSHTHIVKMLIDRPMPFYESNVFMGGALNQACEAGDTATFKLLMQEAKANGGDFDLAYHMAFNDATLYGNLEAVSLLVGAIASADARKKGIDWALELVAANDYPAIAGFLLNAGADPSKEALCAACSSGSVETVRLLLAGGADLSPDPDSTLFAAMKNGNEAIVRMLLDAGADANAKGLLQRMAVDDHVAFLSLLFDFGVDLDVVDDHSKATYADDYFFDAGTNRHYTCASATRAEMALEAACFNGHETFALMILEKLLRKKPALTTFMASLVLERAVAKGLLSVIRVLLDDDAAGLNRVHVESHSRRPTTLMSTAADYYNDNAMGLLLEYGAKTELVGAEVPLHVAIRRRAGVVAQVLLDSGADIMARSTLDKEDTPLHAAARCGNEYVARLLLERGPEIEGRNEAGEPLSK